MEPDKNENDKNGGISNQVTCGNGQIHDRAHLKFMTVLTSTVAYGVTMYKVSDGRPHY